MPTNNEIINIVNWAKAAEIIKDDKGLLTIRIILNSVLNEARADTTSKHTGAIWNWWATKPQKSKNDATIRIITRSDIEELVRLTK